MLATARPERQILRVADLQALLNLSRTTIWRLRRAGEFPQPIRLSANAVTNSGTPPPSPTKKPLRIAQLATSPPPTDPDPAFDHHLAEAASHLAARRRAVLDWVLQSGQRPRPPQPEPPAHEF